MFAVIKGITPAGYTKAVDTQGDEYIVPFGCPGDKAEIEVFGKKNNRKGRISNLIETSAGRIAPRCPHAGFIGSLAGKCGGCAFQYMDYPLQLESKYQLIKEIFTKKDLNYPIEPILPSPQIFHYRNRMDFIISPHGELGLHERGSFNRIVDLGVCHLISPKADRVRAILRQWIAKTRLAGWDPFKMQGLLRYIILRETKNTNQFAVIFVTFEKYLDDYINDLKKELPDFVTHIFNGIQNRPADVSFASDYKSYQGGDYLTETIGGINYLIAPGSFFQTNTEGAEKLLQIVLGFIEEGKPPHVLDWYCGSGFFTLQAAKSVREACGIELDASAIQVAKESLKQNQLSNVSFHSMDVLDFALDKHWDCLILDPPRAGAHPKVLKRILEIKIPQIIYVSCNPDALAYNLKVLGTVYEVEKVQPIDLFPHTPHLEIVVKLRLSPSNRE